ncbi:hypothetical protein [Haloplanus halophilus]|uniref:hypothetical protein n=1 Tax=Haloplanus halophilus TaxID=2949993 RepID=UPI0020404025|nr:hypothetical protein [Haloplanus sp. GDY1]
MVQHTTLAAVVVLVAVILLAVAGGRAVGTGTPGDEEGASDEARAEDGAARGTDGREGRRITEADRERMRRHLAKPQRRRSPDDLLPAESEEADAAEADAEEP